MASVPKIWRLSGTALIAIIGCIASCDALPIGSVVLSKLEARFGTPDLNPNGHLDGIIALGGGRDRMIEAVRLAKLYPDAHLLIAGRGEDRWYDYAKAQGISADRLKIDNRSRNTFENAQYSSVLAQPRSAQRWLLVTSASHMPRAVGAFRQVGFSVIPWPLKSSHTTIEQTNQIAKHEVLGLVGYWLLGRTDALFPGPEPLANSSNAHLAHLANPAPTPSW